MSGNGVKSEIRQVGATAYCTNTRHERVAIARRLVILFKVDQ